MNIVGKVINRSYQVFLRAVLGLCKFREPKVVPFVELADCFCGKCKILLICTKRVYDNTDFVRFCDRLSEIGVKKIVFDRVPPDPHASLVREVVKLYRDNECEAIIAIGGGSVLDCAKAVGASVFTYKDIEKLMGALKVRHRLPLFAAVPTTTGTGSEVTITSVITDDSGKKRTINDFTLIPDVVSLVPQFTTSMPPFLTATTGMDALTHAIEAYVSRYSLGGSDDYAKEAVSLIFKYLPRAVADGNDVHARERMLYASFTAGKAFTRAFVGYVHSLGHAVGARYGVSHGFAMSILLPAVLDAYGSAVDIKLAKLSDAIKLTDINATVIEKSAAFKFTLRKMLSDFGLPDKFDCVKEKDISSICRSAASEANPQYPVPVLFSAKELEKVLRTACNFHQN